MCRRQSANVRSNYRDQGDLKYQLQNLSDVGCGTRPYWAGKDLLSTRQNNRHSFNLWQRTMPCNGNRQRVQMLQKRIFYAIWFGVFPAHHGA